MAGTPRFSRACRFQDSATREIIELICRAEMLAGAGERIDGTGSARSHPMANARKDHECQPGIRAHGRIRNNCESDPHAGAHPRQASCLPLGSGCSLTAGQLPGNERTLGRVQGVETPRIGRPFDPGSILRPAGRYVRLRVFRSYSGAPQARDCHPDSRIGSFS